MLAGVGGAVVSATPASAVGCPCTIFPASSAPGIASAPYDSNAVELGVQFYSDVSGFISAIRFYKGVDNTGTHVGHLWTADGTMLAAATFTNETATGWQQANLASPVAITAGVTYIASYFAPNAHYAYDYFTFHDSIDSPPLHAPPSTDSNPNGVFVYTPTGGFPTSGYLASNYWVDVVFQNGPVPTTTVVSSSNPSTYGQPVTFTAGVSASGGPGSPTGTVTFSDGSAPLGTSPLNSGVATLTTSSLATGSHTITASYPGSSDGIFAPSSGSVTQTVTKASTKLVAAFADKDLGLHAVKFSATLSRSDNNAPVAGQIVVFTVTRNQRFLCQATTTSAGVATCYGDVSLIDALFSTTYTATYGGSSNYVATVAIGRFG